MVGRQAHDAHRKEQRRRAHGVEIARGVRGAAGDFGDGEAPPGHGQAGSNTQKREGVPRRQGRGYTLRVHRGQGAVREYRRYRRREEREGVRGRDAEEQPRRHGLRAARRARDSQGESRDTRGGSLREEPDGEPPDGRHRAQVSAVRGGVQDRTPAGAAQRASVRRGPRVARREGQGAAPRRRLPARAPVPIRRRGLRVTRRGVRPAGVLLVLHVSRRSDRSHQHRPRGALRERDVLLEAGERLGQQRFGVDDYRG